MKKTGILFSLSLFSLFLTILSCDAEFNQSISSKIQEQTTGQVVFISNTFDVDNLTVNLPLGKKYSELPVPESLGKSFAGWYTDETFTTEASDITISKDKQFLYAKWNLNTYEISYILNDMGENNSSNPDQYTIDDSVVLFPATPTDSDKPFLGWYAENTSTKNNKYRIAGWPSRSYAKDFTLCARWPDGISKLKTITYEPADKIINDTRNFGFYESDESGTIFAPVYKENNSVPFRGWYLSSDFSGSSVSSLEQLGAQNATLYAKFGYDIIYHDNYAPNFRGSSKDSDGKDLPQTYIPGSSLKLPTPVFNDPAQGVSFCRWYTDSDSKDSITEIPSDATGTIDLWALWSNHIYWYDAYEESGTPNLYNTYILGENHTFDFNQYPPVDTSDSDAIFGGAFNDKECTTSFSSISKKETGIVKFFVKWEYKLSFKDENDAEYSGSNISQLPSTYIKHKGFENLPDGVKGGYKFCGWHLNSDCSDDAVTSIANDTTGPLTLYAKWEVDSDISSDNVNVYYHDYYQNEIFSGNDTDSSGTPLPEFYAKNTGLVTLPDPVNADSAEFLGWYESSTSETPLTQITVGTSDIHLYAKWKFKKFYLDPVNGNDEYYGYNSLYPVKTIERAAAVIKKINPDTNLTNIKSLYIKSTVNITENKTIDLSGAKICTSGDFPAIRISNSSPSTAEVTIKNTNLYSSSIRSYPAIICENQNLVLDEGFRSSIFTGISTNIIQITGGSLKIQNSSTDTSKLPIFSSGNTSSDQGLITLINSDLYITAANLSYCNASKSSPIFVKADDDKTHSVEISNLNAQYNTGKNGGVIYIEGTKSYPVNVTINGNQSVPNIEFSNNTASLSGGAIYAKNAVINLNTYARFTNNISNGTEKNNDGGAIYLDNCKLGSTDDPSTSTESSYFYQNKAKNNGGAIFYINGDDADSTLFNASFLANQATSDGDITTSPNCSGGAVFVTYEDSNSSQNLKIQNCTFQQNKASNGGAVAIEANSTVLITSTTFGNGANSSYNNTATNGCDIFLNETPSGYSDSKVTLQDTKLYDMYSLVDFTISGLVECKNQCYLGTLKKILVTNPTSTNKPSFVLKIPDTYPTGTPIVSFENNSLRELYQDNFSLVDSSGFVLKASGKDLLVELAGPDQIPSIESLTDGEIPARGSTYSVSSKDSFNKLNALSASTSFEEVTFVLSNDLPLIDEGPISPIGTEEKPFMGTFDGQGHTINVTIPNNSYSAGALFAYAKNATIKNVTIKGSIGSNGCAGSLIGIGSGNITIDNCISDADVYTNSNQCAGGIIGKYIPDDDNVCCIIDNCINLRTVRGSSYIGGILGGIDATASHNSNMIYINNCANYGHVSINGTDGYIGGITAGSSDDNIAIYLNNCFNDAVLVTTPSAYVAALIPLTTNNCFIEYCYYNNDNIQAVLGSCGTNNVVSYTKNSNSTPYTATKDVAIDIGGNQITDTNILTLLNSYIARDADYKKWEERDGQLLFQ